MAPAAPGVEAEGARPGTLHSGAAASPADVGATQATQPAPNSGRDLPVSKGAAVDGVCASAAPVPSNSSDDSAGLAPVRGGPLGRCAAPARSVWQAGRLGACVPAALVCKRVRHMRERKRTPAVACCVVVWELLSAPATAHFKNKACNLEAR